MAHRSDRGDGGKLKIGDDWNAIRIIALSQSNPLKAIAEFVENSIDARATTITIARGRERGEHYLRIRDDGEGVPRDADGVLDFKYVATHICDSIKRRLKADGHSQRLQGEFGIGLSAGLALVARASLADLEWPAACLHLKTPIRTKAPAGTEMASARRESPFIEAITDCVHQEARLSVRTFVWPSLFSLVCSPDPSTRSTRQRRAI